MEPLVEGSEVEERAWEREPLAQVAQWSKVRGRITHPCGYEPNSSYLFSSFLDEFCVNHIYLNV